MKSWVLGCLLSFTTGGFGLSAQTWDELFRQKETQQEYLILQIGALKIQSEFLNEASKIVRFGLNSIYSWKEVEKGLHEEFFYSFKHMGPLALASWQRLNDAGLHPSELRERIRKSQIHWHSQANNQLDRGWLEQIHSGMMHRCNLYSNQLELILGNSLELDDGSRAELIEQVGKEILGLSRDLAQVQMESQVRLAQQVHKNYQLNFQNQP